MTFPWSRWHAKDGGHIPPTTWENPLMPRAQRTYVCGGPVPRLMPRAQRTYGITDYRSSRLGRALGRRQIDLSAVRHRDGVSQAHVKTFERDKARICSADRPEGMGRKPQEASGHSPRAVRKALASSSEMSLICRSSIRSMGLVPCDSANSSNDCGAQKSPPLRINSRPPLWRELPPVRPKAAYRI